MFKCCCMHFQQLWHATICCVYIRTYDAYKRAGANKSSRVCMLARNCIDTMYLVGDYWSVRDRFISSNFLKCNFNFYFIPFVFFVVIFSFAKPHTYSSVVQSHVSLLQNEEKNIDNCMPFLFLYFFLLKTKKIP